MALSEQVKSELESGEATPRDFMLFMLRVQLDSYICLRMAMKFHENQDYLRVETTRRSPTSDSAYMAVLKILAITFNQLIGTHRPQREQKELFEAFACKREFEILELLDFNLNLPTCTAL